MILRNRVAVPNLAKAMWRRLGLRDIRAFDWHGQSSHLQHRLDQEPSSLLVPIKISESHVPIVITGHHSDASFDCEPREGMSALAIDRVG